MEIRLAAGVNYAGEGTGGGGELGKREGIEKGFLGEIDYGAVRIKLYVNDWVSITWFSSLRYTDRRYSVTAFEISGTYLSGCPTNVP